MKRIVLFIGLLLLGLSSKAQSYTCNYWFDADIEHIQTRDLGEGHFSLDVSSLSPGLHWLNVMLKKTECSITERFLFCKVEEVVGETSLDYWFDTDATGIHHLELTGEAVLIDVSALSVGNHILHLQLRNEMGATIQSYEFFRSPINTGVDENENDGVSVYPNPANDYLYVECANTVTRCDVYRIDGTLVYSTSNSSERAYIDLSGIPSGIYVLGIVSGNQVVNRHLIKR